MEQRWIGLLDCNNFFVSCERLFRPDLVGKPVVVLSSNDGCVVARSQEVRDSGIPMGVPYFQIKDKLKEMKASVFSSHFALYRDLSRRVFSVMREELDVVEQYSIDEAFFIVPDDQEAFAKRLRERVWREVGIPVSIGVSSTKTRAKLANAVAKKTTGICLLDEFKFQELASLTPLSSVWGIGGRLSLRFKQHHLHTVSDLIQADAARVRALFGVVGLQIKQELSGLVTFPLKALAEPQKSIMSSRSFASTTSDLAVLNDALAYHVRHAMADLRAMGRLAGTVRVLLKPSRHGDFFLRGGVREAVFPTPTADTFAALNTAERLLKVLYEAGVPYQKAGIQLANLVPEKGGGEQTLFTETDSSESRESILGVIDELNKHSGKELILMGSRLRTMAWQTKSKTLSLAYTTRWQDIAVVKAK